MLKKNNGLLGMGACILECDARIRQLRGCILHAEYQLECSGRLDGTGR